MNRQSSIPVKDPKPDPSKCECEWCDETAAVAVEITTAKGMGTGQYVYACWKHESKAQELAWARRR